MIVRFVVLLVAGADFTILGASVRGYDGDRSEHRQLSRDSLCFEAQTAGRKSRRAPEVDFCLGPSAPDSSRSPAVACGDGVRKRNPGLEGY